MWKHGRLLDCGADKRNYEMSTKDLGGNDRVIDITARLAEKAGKVVDLAEARDAKEQEVTCEGGVCQLTAWKPRKSA